MYTMVCDYATMDIIIVRFWFFKAGESIGLLFNVLVSLWLLKYIRKFQVILHTLLWLILLYCLFILDLYVFT